MNGLKFLINSLLLNTHTSEDYLLADDGRTGLQ